MIYPSSSKELPRDAPSQRAEGDANAQFVPSRVGARKASRRSGMGFGRTADGLGRGKVLRVLTVLRVLRVRVLEVLAVLEVRVPRLHR